MLAAFLGLGLLLTFTPCVLPMIPILSSIIVGQGEQVSTRRAFALSLTYVLSIIGGFTLIGFGISLVMLAVGGGIEVATYRVAVSAGSSRKYARVRVEDR